ncbi:MAG TPA: glycosyltransferase family 4 protein [Tepidisphaeraceae bacterium]|jgi:glycosyltransferase involved in cell wall biosynthesis|nr:glycosyltransferase family 4 protein [Tepidisphaeraceae bacterium]
MNIAFADFCQLRYDVRTVGEAPLGGTESAACYLTRALAGQGHEVFLLGNVPAEGVYEGVRCVAMRSGHSLPWPTLDALICMGRPGDPVALGGVLAPRTRLISWQQHAADQPAVQFLRDPVRRDAYDAFAMVSRWQLEKYQAEFGIDPPRMGVMRNAVGFAFEKQFGPGEAILPHKGRPPVLAYTSTPFRGLDVLLEVFPRIRQAVPGTRLKVFSSTAVYQTEQARDEAGYGHLYRRCREIDGVEYIGSLPQPQLARALRGVWVLAYPNTFAETSCISVMEAMASGCRVVTTELAALPETCAGFARLVRAWPTSRQYFDDFVAQTVEVLREALEQPAAVEPQLRAAVNYINDSATWDLRARQWTQWIGDMRRR